MGNAADADASLLCWSFCVLCGFEAIPGGFISDDFHLKTTQDTNRHAEEIR